MVTIRGWTLDKQKIAMYVFNDKTKANEVDDYYCDDAISYLEGEINAIKPGLSVTVNKNDSLLLMSLHYLTACLMIKSGKSTQRSNVIQSESMEGMSVSYARDQQDTLKNKIPYDYCSMGLDLINRFAITNKLLTRNIVMSVKNYRDDIWNGIYDKYNPNGR